MPSCSISAGCAPRTCCCSATRAARATTAEHDAIAERGIRAIAQDEVAADAAGAAHARARRTSGPFLLHFDTDSIDFADLPLAENTDRNVGLSFETVAAAVDALCEGELGAVTVTEINPHHGEPDGATLRRFLDRFVRRSRASRAIASIRCRRTCGTGRSSTVPARRSPRGPGARRTGA